MDAKVLYWSGALINFGAIVILASRGVRLIRRGEVARHRRAMLSAGALVLGFLASYALKLRFLGREDLALWTQTDLWILRFHETCVLLMILAGCFAIQRAWRMRGSRMVTKDPADHATPSNLRRWHRRGGWTAVVAAVFGLVSAGFVLAGMFRRLA